MRIFGRKKEKEKLVLVFDIGSSSVGGALFYMQKSGVPKILFSLRESIMLEESVEADRFLFLIIKALKVIVSKICNAGLGAPDKIFCVLSSPWHISQTRTIKLEKNTPFIFTAKLADELIQKEVALFEDENVKKNMNTSKLFRSIEIKNIKVMLNGYESSNPLNKKAKVLEMTVFISISGEQILKKIEGTIREHFNFQDIKFSSFMLSSFAVVRDMYAHQDNFLLIDIEGEMTNISMIKKNILRESISFPFGVNFMIRRVASLLACSLSEAKSYIILFQNGHIESSVAKKLEKVLSKLKTEWLAKFQESLINLSNDISIPAIIYMSIDKEYADFFSQIIKAEQYNQYTLTESNFKITVLNTEVFNGMVQFNANILRDQFLIINSVFINRFFS